MRALQHLKKLIVFAGIVVAVNLLINSKAAADNSETYLYYIMQYTYGILDKVNNLPTYLDTITKMALSWSAPDDSEVSGNLQQQFTAYGSTLNTQLTTQSFDQQQLAADIFNVPRNNITFPTDKPAILSSLPNANDVIYATVLGQPLIPKAPASAYNYVKNAGGISINHIMPSAGWQGSDKDKTKYNNFYNTVTAIESFNGYILNNMYANQPTFTQAQSSLISQASAAAWFTQVGSEDLGKVLRQILLFVSQTYLLIGEMVQIQKQVVAAQAMTNSLLILNNQNYEGLIVSKAQGVPLRP